MCIAHTKHASKGPSRETGHSRRVFVCACLALCVLCRYSQAICRGLIQEGARGSKRCIGPRDMDLVSRGHGKGLCSSTTAVGTTACKCQGQQVAVLCDAGRLALHQLHGSTSCLHALHQAASITKHCSKCNQANLSCCVCYKQCAACGAVTAGGCVTELLPGVHSAAGQHLHHQGLLNNTAVAGCEASSAGGSAEL